MTGTRALAIVLTCALAAGSASAQKTYGTGTAGSGAIVPTISCGQAWMGNLGWGVQISDALGGAPGVLLMGPSPSNLTVGPYPVFVDLPTSWPLVPFTTNGPLGTPGAGEWFYPFPLPIAENPVLAGLNFYFQGAVFDPSGPGGAALTSGLQLELTMTPRVFVASSVAGSSDPWTLVDPIGMSSVTSGGSSATNNVKGAIFTNSGTKLYVESGFNGLAVADIVSGAPISWTPLLPWAPNSGIASRSIQVAEEFGLLWGIGDPGIGSMQLTAMDMDPSSGTYGFPLYSTINLSTNLIGTFGLSNDGRRACVPSLLGGAIRVWDTDPTSANFLGNVDLFEPGIPIPLPSTTIPSGVSALWANTTIAWSVDDSELFVLRQGAGATPSEIARYSFALGGWMDHNPSLAGIQNIGPNSVPPVVLGSAGTSMSMAKDGSFLVVSGFGGPGWCGRIDIAANDPSVLSYTPATGTDFSNAWRSSINPDGTVVAVACGAGFRLNFFDTATMSFITSVPLSSTSATNIAWR